MAKCQNENSNSAKNSFKLFFLTIFKKRIIKIGILKAIQKEHFINSFISTFTGIKSITYVFLEIQLEYIKA